MRVIVGAGKVATVIGRSTDVILPHSQIDVRDYRSIVRQLKKFAGENISVINTASKINLEWCEENKNEAYDVNTVGAINVAKACKEFDLHLVHVSSGCIFDGGESEKVYTENDIPSPAAWYTKSKADADQGILELGYKKVTIVRPRQLISKLPYTTNMITKFLSLGRGKFITSKNSLTCIEDMGDMIDYLIDGKHYGVYNLANTGYTSPYEIALRVREINPSLIVEKIDYDEYVKTLPVRRVNTLLDVSKLMSIGYVPQSASDALDWCIKNYGK